MAWSDVPAKLVQYALADYAPPLADVKLLAEYGVTNVANVPAHRQEEFEEALDYRLGACLELAKSRGTRWHL